eukprot:14421415-Alexandrium_andersonii.AAC.1
MAGLGLRPSDAGDRNPPGIGIARVLLERGVPEERTDVRHQVELDRRRPGAVLERRLPPMVAHSSRQGDLSSEMP